MSWMTDHIIEQVASGAMSAVDGARQVSDEVAAAARVATDRGACARAALTGYLTRGANFGSPEKLADQCVKDAEALVDAVTYAAVRRAEMMQLLREVDSGAYNATPEAHAQWLARVKTLVSWMVG